MAKKVGTGGVREAAAERAAAEARRRAADAARKAAVAAREPARLGDTVGQRDELSTGVGSALKVRAQKQLALEKPVTLSGEERPSGSMKLRDFQASEARSGRHAASALPHPQPGPGGTTYSEGANAVGRDESAYEGAKAAADEADQQLAGELAQLGSSLSPEQRDAFIKAFRAAHSKVYETRDGAGAKLAQDLRTYAKDLEAQGGVPGIADLVERGLKDLASSPYGKEALALAKEFCSPPNSPLAQAIVKCPGFQDDVLKPAMSSAAAQAVADGGDPENALQQLIDTLEPVMSAMEAAGAVKDVQELKSVLSAVHAAAKGDFGALRELSKEGKLPQSPMARGLLAAALIFGAASAVSDAQKQDYVGLVRDLAQSGQAGCEIVADALRSVSKVGTVLRTADVAARLVPILGLVASAAALAVDVSQGISKGDAGLIIAALGDAISCVGNLIDCLGPEAAPVGELIDAFGVVVSCLGLFFSGVIKKGQMTDEMRALLAKAGVDPSSIEALANADPQRIRDLQQMGLTPADIQRIAKEFPDLLIHPNMYPLNRLKGLAKAFALSGQEIVGLMEAASGGNPEVLSAFLMNMGRMGGAPAGTSLDAWRKWLSDNLLSPLPAGSPGRSATERALNFLAHLDRTVRRGLET